VFVSIWTVAVRRLFGFSRIWNAEAGRKAKLPDNHFKRWRCSEATQRSGHTDELAGRLGRGYFVDFDRVDNEINRRDVLATSDSRVHGLYQRDTFILIS